MKNNKKLWSERTAGEKALYILSCPFRAIYQAVAYIVKFFGVILNVCLITIRRGSHCRQYFICSFQTYV